MVTVLITLTAIQFDVNPGLVDSIIAVFLLLPLITRWFVTYERGTLNRSGHIHILMEGRINFEVAALKSLLLSLVEKSS